MNWNIFSTFSRLELQAQAKRTAAKIDAIKKMLVENPTNIFLQSQLSQQLEKQKAIVKELKN